MSVRVLSIKPTWLSARLVASFTVLLRYVLPVSMVLQWFYLSEIGSRFAKHSWFNCFCRALYFRNLFGPTTENVRFHCILHFRFLMPYTPQILSFFIALSTLGNILARSRGDQSITVFNYILLTWRPGLTSCSYPRTRLGRNSNASLLGLLFCLR